MTKREMLAEIKNYIENGTATVTTEDMVAWINKEDAILAKKKASSNTKAKAETAERAERVYNALSEMDGPVTARQLQELTSDEEVAGYTPNRLTALLTKLGTRIIKEKVKGIMHYSVA